MKEAKSKTPDPFKLTVDISRLSSRINDKNTGHSAGFVGAYADVKGYWDQLYGDIQ